MSQMDRIIIDQEYYLSKITEKDYYQLSKIIGDRDVSMNLLLVPYPYSLEDAKWWVNHVNEQTVEFGRIINWSIRNKEGKLIGGIGQHLAYGENSHKDEIGYWLCKDSWGKGVMSAVIKAYCAYLFKTTGLIRIEAPIFSSNKGSEKVLKKNKFQFEGVLSKAYFKDGEYIDAKMYALIKG